MAKIIPAFRGRHHVRMALFAVNSSLHSYLIVAYAKEDGVSLDVGFYYMSNAMGRLIGTLLSGWVYQAYGLQACLWISCLFIVLAAVLSLGLPFIGLASEQSSRVAAQPSSQTDRRDSVR